ncbi:MAG TPA: heavy-metal-associated domain-containing protein [Verrucomicrobia bacterium]|nr:heavy-metal-associated domain-containing protein [Verrucomicrobiota bacterium]HOP98407.1 heavy-metal-associated domain-containing protein [Verrucomicrobiota bacterium]
METNLQNDGTETRRIGIAGMTCEKCVRRVEKALRGVDGVRDVQVDLNSAVATVRFETARTNIASLHEALLQSGYRPSAEMPV